jgi:hypothetical protein
MFSAQDLRINYNSYTSRSNASIYIGSIQGGKKDNFDETQFATKIDGFLNFASY